MEGSLDHEMSVPGETLDEQSAYFDAHPEEIESRYLNNFHLWTDPEYIGMFRGSPRILDSLPKESNERYSPLRNGQTLREFVASVDAALNVLPGLREQMRILRASRATPQERNATLLELYKMLRTQGYSHYDLVV